MFTCSNHKIHLGFLESHPTTVSLTNVFCLPRAVNLISDKLSTTSCLLLLPLQHCFIIWVLSWHKKSAAIKLGTWFKQAKIRILATMPYSIVPAKAHCFPVPLRTPALLFGRMSLCCKGPSSSLACISCQGTRHSTQMEAEATAPPLPSLQTRVHKCPQQDMRLQNQLEWLPNSHLPHLCSPRGQMTQMLLLFKGWWDELLCGALKLGHWASFSYATPVDIHDALLGHCCSGSLPMLGQLSRGELFRWILIT